MRADRLLALLMLLQSRGRMTAEDLARELEVSVRTIYRDLTALSTSGVPVYAERGPGGGVGLLEEYRTTLTGLTPDEARALFMLSVPAPLVQLGVGGDLKAAMRKLSAALPSSRRLDEARIHQRIQIDSSWWFQSADSVPCLQSIQQALWQDRMLRIRYRSFQNVEVEQLAAPYGLVAKANLWHLVYGLRGAVRVRQVATILDAEMLPETFTRPPEFHLGSLWESWCAEYESRPPFVACVRASPRILTELPYQIGHRFQRLTPAEAQPDADGWVTLELPFESFADARSRLLGMGRAVEVLSPEALRSSLLDFARQVVDFYRGRDQKMGDVEGM